MKKSNYLLIWIVVFLFISNPSIKSFKEYIGQSSYDGLRRKINLFLISIYEANDTTYIGIFGNFIPIIYWVEKKVEIKPLPADSNISTSTSTDTTLVNN